jgi:hypothetical protein
VRLGTTSFTAGRRLAGRTRRGLDHDRDEYVLVEAETMKRRRRPFREAIERARVRQSRSRRAPT